MATKLDQEWVGHVRKVQAEANEGFETLAREVERLEKLQGTKDGALIIAQEVLSAVMHNAPGYDWNADPLHLTKEVGDAFAAIKEALT